MKSESGATEKTYFLLNNDYFIITIVGILSIIAHKNSLSGNKLGSCDDEENDADDETRG